MKYISVILFSALVGLAIASLSEIDTKLKSGEQNFDHNHMIHLRTKRSIGADKSYKREYEIKTKSGATIKVSKSFTYNDGGAITLLPQLLDSIALNKKRIIEALRNKKGGAVVEEPSTTEPPVATGDFDFDPLVVDPAPSVPVEVVPVAPVDVAPAAPVEVVPPAPVVDTPAAPVQAVPATPVVHVPAFPVVHFPAVVAVNPYLPDCNQPTGHLDVHDGIHGGHHGNIHNHRLAKHKKAGAGGLHKIHLGNHHKLGHGSLKKVGHHGGHHNSLLGVHHGSHQDGYHNGLGVHHGGYQGGLIGKHHGHVLAKRHSDFLDKHHGIHQGDLADEYHENLHGQHHSRLYGKHHSDQFVGNHGLQSDEDNGPTKLQQLKQLRAYKNGVIFQKASEAILKIVEPKKIGPPCCPYGPCCPDRVQKK